MRKLIVFNLIWATAMCVVIAVNVWYLYTHHLKLF
jgi:hypothetical protein